MKSCLVNGSFLLLLLFWCSNCPTFCHWKFPQWPFDISSPFLEHFFTFWHSKTSQTSSCTLPNLECAISLRNLVSFSGEWCFKTWSWAFRCVYCFWTVVVPRPSQWAVDRALRYVSVQAHTWKHTYICSYVGFIPSNVYWQPWGGPSPGMEAFPSPPNALKDCIAQKEEGIEDYFFIVWIKSSQMLATFFLHFFQPLGVLHLFLQTNLHFSGYMIGTVYFIGRSL